MAKSTFHRPATGARDLLPLDVVQKQWVERHLRNVFERWGYRRIITPTLERLDTLTAGGAVQPASVLQVRDSEGTMLGLRPEMTASIARAAATRMAGTAFPLRLYYNANVFRNARHDNEFFQAGVELIGAPGWLADTEVMLLLAECMFALDLDDWSLIVGEVGLTESLLSSISPSAKADVHRAIASLDRVFLETAEMSETDRQAALQVLDLRGEPRDVFRKLKGLTLPSTERQRVTALEQLCNGLAEQRVPLVLDLSLLDGFGYYTCTVFQVVCGSERLGLGGRYDSLFSLYSPNGREQAGIGFSLTLESLQRVLQTSARLPQSSRKTQTLVVPTEAEAVPHALNLAAELRSKHPDRGIEIELLGDFVIVDEGRTPEAISEYARSCEIEEIAWVQADGSFHTTTTHQLAIEQTVGEAVK